MSLNDFSEFVQINPDINNPYRSDQNIPVLSVTLISFNCSEWRNYFQERIFQPLSRAAFLSFLSGLTHTGLPTIHSAGRSETESP